MNSDFFACLCALILMAVWAPAGARDTSTPPPATVVAEWSQPATAYGVPEAKRENGTPGRELAGTSWRLVKIMSMDEEVRTTDPREMQDIVLTRMFDHYAEEHGIEVSETEIDAFTESMRRGMRAEGLTAEDDLTPEEAREVEQMRRDMGRSMIRQWKLNRELYRQYGGRIIFQQLGSEPLDAYRSYLEEREAAGDFAIHEKAFEDEFWRYFTDETMHSFYQPGSTKAAQAFAIPPWGRAAGGEYTSTSGANQ